MASQFSEFWNYQQYYRNGDYYKTHHQNYNPQNVYQNNQYYNQMSYIKEEDNKKHNNLPSCVESSTNSAYEERLKYQKYENQSLLRNCLENNISSPPNTPNSGINPNETPNQFESRPSYDYNEINRSQNYILESPPKTPISSQLKPEVKPVSPEKHCDSPALIN